MKKQKLLHYHTFLAARVVACASFLMLAIIAASSLVFAMSLDSVPEEDGIPAAWEVSSIKNPATITVPITYWDQHIDTCDDADRQFEWGKCHYWTKGALQGIVKEKLGSDHLPVPTFTDSDAAWEANHDIFTANVTGHDPVVSSDNFYRWFHEVDGLSKVVKGRTITFTRDGDSSTYNYGGQNIFPLDDLGTFGDNDTKLRGADGKMHNFHFTGHLRIAMRITASGQEKFQFSGDDDVWVYLNDHLILDIGGLHEALSGWFTINQDGTINTHVNSVSNVANRTEELTSCMKVVRTANSQCNVNFNNFLVQHNQPANDKLDIGLKAGDIVYLDFFYAERSSDGSNTHITIENMDWPISAHTVLAGEVVEELENSNIVEYSTSLTNRDPEHTLTLERMASYIKDTYDEDSVSGFIPLSSETLYYTTTPEDNESWQKLGISAPDDSATGFVLDAPLSLASFGSQGDTVYFHYFAETASTNGTIENVVSYYTDINKSKRVVHADTTLAYERKTPDVPDPVNPIDPDPVDPEPVNPVDPEPNPNPNPVNPEPSTPTRPITPSEPANSDAPTLPAPGLDDNLVFIAPLGEVAYVPNTGIVAAATNSPMADFAEVVLSQRFVMAVLLIFAISFALLFHFRKSNHNPKHDNTPKPKRNSQKPTSTKKSPARTTRKVTTVKSKTTKATKNSTSKKSSKTATKQSKTKK